MRKIPVWAEEQLNCRRYMAEWIRKSVERWRHVPWGSGHDEGIFTRAWQGFYLLTGDQTAYDYLDMLVHQFIASSEVEACTCFLRPEDAEEYAGIERRPPYHGYPAEQACFVHAPENYAWFLTHMAHINPAPEILRALEDVAEHVGNWCPDSPPWYDWDNHRFRSILVGTRRVRDYPPYDVDCMRMVPVIIPAFNMYHVTLEEKYLDLCSDYADKWAEIVNSAGNEGFCPMRFPCADELVPERYPHLAHWHSWRWRYDDDLCHFLLDTYYYTRQQNLADAARRMLKWALETPPKPGGDGAVPGIAFAKYRRLTGDTSLDDSVICFTDPMLIEDESRTGLLFMHKASELALETSGMWYVRQFKDGTILRDERQVGYMMAAYQITGDLKYLEYALKLAGSRFLDSHYIWDGRELGCRGSWMGRNGVALRNIMPAICMSALGGITMLAGERPWMEVRYWQKDGRPGLPDKVAALLLPGPTNERRIRFVNVGDETAWVRIEPDSTNLKPTRATLDGATVGDPSEGIEIPPGNESELSMWLS